MNFIFIGELDILFIIKVISQASYYLSVFVHVYTLFFYLWVIVMIVYALLLKTTLWVNNNSFKNLLCMKWDQLAICFSFILFLIGVIPLLLGAQRPFPANYWLSNADLMHNTSIGLFMWDWGQSFTHVLCPFELCSWHLNTVWKTIAFFFFT